MRICERMGLQINLILLIQILVNEVLFVLVCCAGVNCFVTGKPAKKWSYWGRSY